MLFFGFVGGQNFNNLVPFLDTLFCDLKVFDFSNQVVFVYSKGVCSVFAVVLRFCFHLLAASRLVSCLKAVRLFMWGAGITLCVFAFKVGKNCRPKGKEVATWSKYQKNETTIKMPS